MVFLKDLLEEYGGFMESLGMKGKKIAYGEEIRVVLDLFNNGYDIYYACQMKIKHLIQKNRLNLWWLLKSNYYTGKSSAEMYNNKYPLSLC